LIIDFKIVSHSDRITTGTFTEFPGFVVVASRNIRKNWFKPLKRVVTLKIRTQKSGTMILGESV
jgi:hypothetical protein